jgi:hypothetical protein
LRGSPRARSAWTSGSVVPDTSASSISRPDTPSTSVAIEDSFTPAPSSTLCRRLASRARSWISDLRYRVAAPMRVLLALSGIAIAASSLIGLWISDSSSLFGFTDYGFRPTIMVAIVAESLTIAVDRVSRAGKRRSSPPAQASPEPLRRTPEEGRRPGAREARI